MSEFYDDLTQDDDRDNDLVRQLRKALKEVTKERDALKGEVSTLRSEKRAATVEKVLKDKGVNTKVAKLMPADLDPTDEAVSAWLEEWADVFNIQVPDAEGGEGAETEAASGSGAGVDPADRAAFEQARRAETGGGVNPLIGHAQQQKVLAEARGMSAEEAFAHLKAHGLAV